MSRRTHVPPLPPRQKRATSRRATGRVTGRAAGVAVSTAIAATLAFAMPANAMPAAPTQRVLPAGATASPPVPVSDAVLRAAAESGATLPLTLITGDTVHVGINDKGTPVVRDIEAAPRSDGSTVAFHTITRNGSIFVVPNDALSLLGGGLLDWGLFNLAKLAAHVASGTLGQVPVLVTYNENVAAQKAPNVAGTTARSTLPSINARSLTVAGDGRWWQEVRGKNDAGSASARSAGSLTGVKKVWLNELARINLDASVPQIGAPIAWDRGFNGSGVTVAVLDTGIDPNHPDVAGQIIEAVDFTGSASGAKDGHGHGTHVAATIAGTGAASNGLRPGVAPGAKLLIGRVCGDGGSCATDAIIAGMEWAAQSAAKVVSMSLGGGATDGTDPMSQAVNNLSRSTGRLFVIAAGNAGPASGTVGTPGAADEALTVAAVDKDDEMANFSSRGPRVGDGAAKPDIAAPGVNIVAARAAGTSMGTVVDEFYTTASGTSMATPHVAGAAAIIAGKHPNLVGHEVKAFLMSSATDLGHDLYAQGAGRVDLARAIDPSIIATGSLNFGRFAYPHSPSVKTVTYTNHTDQPVTLKLTTAISAGGQPAPAGLFTLDANEVTVPAHGATGVNVTLDGSVLGTAGPYGRYNGVLSAHDPDGALRASNRVGSFLEPPRMELTINVTPPVGATSVGYGNAVIIPVDDQVSLHDDPITMPGGGTMTARLFGGTYAAGVAVTWRDAAGEVHQAVPVAAEVTLTKATSVALDLRKAKPITVNAPQATEVYHAVNQFERVSATGAWGMTAELEARYGAYDSNWWALPTSAVSMGTLSHSTYRTQVTPSVTMRVTGSGSPFNLSVRYSTPDISVAGGSQVWQQGDTSVSRAVRLPVPRLPTRGTKAVVYGGTGSAADLAKVRVRGKLVLLTPSDICTSTCAFAVLRERVATAAAAGAIGVLVAGAPGMASLGQPPTPSVTCADGPQSCPAVEPYAALPIVTVPADEADRLIRRVTRASGPASHVQIMLGGSADPAVYTFAFHSDGRVPGNLPYQVRSGDVDRVDHKFHANRPGEVNSLSWMQWAKNGPTPAAMRLPLTATQHALTTFVGRQHEAINQYQLSWADYAAPSALAAGTTEYQEILAGGRKTVAWNTGPTVPGAAPVVRTRSGFTADALLLCSGCRQGNTFYPTFYVTSSSGGRQAMIGIINDGGVSQFFFGIANCEASACDFRLKDGSGTELERRLVPISFGIGSGKPGSPATLISGGQR